MTNCFFFDEIDFSSLSLSLSLSLSRCLSLTFAHGPIQSTVLIYKREFHDIIVLYIFFVSPLSHTIWMKEQVSRRPLSCFVFSHCLHSSALAALLLKYRTSDTRDKLQTGEVEEERSTLSISPIIHCTCNVKHPTPCERRRNVQNVSRESGTPTCLTNFVSWIINLIPLMAVKRQY